MLSHYILCASSVHETRGKPTYADLSARELRVHGLLYFLKKYIILKMAGSLIQQTKQAKYVSVPCYLLLDPYKLLLQWAITLVLWEWPIFQRQEQKCWWGCGGKGRVCKLVQKTVLLFLRLS